MIWAYQMSRNRASAYRVIASRTRPGRRARPGPRPRAGQPAVERQHVQTGGQPHQIPLERAREGLVEVTEVERQLPLRRGPQPEVEDMGVTAHLHRQTTVGPRGEVGGHDGGGTAEVGPRRRRHAAVADGNQVGRPIGVLREHGSQGVMTAPASVPITRILPRQPRPSRPSARPALVHGEMVLARRATHGRLPYHLGDLQLLVAYGRANVLPLVADRGCTGGRLR